MEENQEARTGTALSSADFFSSSTDWVDCVASVAAAASLFCARRCVALVSYIDYFVETRTSKFRNKTAIVTLPMAGT